MFPRQDGPDVEARVNPHQLVCSYNPQQAGVWVTADGCEEARRPRHRVYLDTAF